MTYNKLKLNENKTEFLIIGSPFNLKNLPDIELTVGNSAIRPSESARNLSVYFDCTMSMASHITYICNIVRFYLFNISKIRKYIDCNACHHAVRGLILSRLDYCNRLLTSVPVSHLKRLQSLQNWAARLIYRTNRRQDSSPLLQSLHWLPISKRVCYKLLLLVYTCSMYMICNFLVAPRNRLA